MDNEKRELIFHKYMRTSKMLSHRTYEYMRPIGLSRGQAPLLMALWKEDEQSRSQLCGSMERKPATISKMVRRLENNGFVTSRIDHQDSRISRVCLTQKAKEIEDIVKEKHTQLHTNIFKGLTSEEMTIFENLLDRIQENMMTMENNQGE